MHFSAFVSFRGTLRANGDFGGRNEGADPRRSKLRTARWPVLFLSSPEEFFVWAWCSSPGKERSTSGRHRRGEPPRPVVSDAGSLNQAARRDSGVLIGSFSSFRSQCIHRSGMWTTAPELFIQVQRKSGGKEAKVPNCAKSIYRRKRPADKLVREAGHVIPS
jgi:hypothetical protein